MLLKNMNRNQSHIIQMLANHDCSSSAVSSGKGTKIMKIFDKIRHRNYTRVFYGKCWQGTGSVATTYVRILSRFSCIIKFSFRLLRDSFPSKFISAALVKHSFRYFHTTKSYPIGQIQCQISSARCSSQRYLL